MKKKVIGILICMLFVISVFCNTFYCEKIINPEEKVTNCESCADEREVIIASQNINRQFIPEITYTDDPLYHVINTIQPTVVIESPDDGEELTDPYIVVEGYAASETYMNYLEWVWEWDNGSQTGGEEIDPVEYYEFNIDIGPLDEGENTITVTLFDVEGESGSDSVTIYYVVSNNGFRIVSVFQPVQTNYLHDTIYEDDLHDGWEPKCDYYSTLDMIAEKNTLLFGYPYNERFTIKITACNTKDKDVKCYFTFTIYPDGKEVWCSPLETVPKKTTLTFSYNAPIPSTPFQWEWTGTNNEWEGYIVLNAISETGESVTGGQAPCECERVKLDVDIRHTNSVNVLIVPLRFGNGPEIPSVFNPNKYNEFNQWRLETLEPWWNAIYPVRENDVDTDYLYNVKWNFRIKTSSGDVWIKSLEDYNNAPQSIRKAVIMCLFKVGGTSSWMTGYDRIVFLAHPDILHYDKADSKPVGLAANIRRLGSSHKLGVIVDWNNRGDTIAHEISHTYGLLDNYIYNKTQGKITYTGDKAPGYWVNKKQDKPTSCIDLMGSVNNLGITWIKKPNFKKLYNELSKERDPAVLGVSGFIDKDNNVELSPWYKLNEGYVDLPWDSTGEYLVRTYDKNNILLDETGFNVSYDMLVDYLNSDKTDIAIFNFRVEWINGMHCVEIVNSSTNQVIASRTITTNVPTIDITKPSNEEKVRPSEFNIEWKGSDSDDNTLTYSVFFQNKSQEQWVPIIMETENNSVIADFTDFPDENYMIKVVVTDGWNTAEDTVDIIVKKGKGKIEISSQRLLFYNILRWLLFLNDSLTKSVIPQYFVK